MPTMHQNAFGGMAMPRPLGSNVLPSPVAATRGPTLERKKGTERAEGKGIERKGKRKGRERRRGARER